jgi:hypothetical protein
MEPFQAVERLPHKGYWQKLLEKFPFKAYFCSLTQRCGCMAVVHGSDVITPYYSAINETAEN